MSFFDKDFRKEDLFLYLVVLCLLIFFSYYFIQSREIATRVIEMDKNQNLTSQEYYFQIFRYKYDFATKALALNSMRNNVLFMVGSILCLLGTMVVVRRLRDSVEAGASNEGFSFSFKTSSPGVYLVLIGFLMLITPVLIKDHYAITEGGTEMRTEPQFDRESSSPSDNEQSPGIGPE